MAMLAEVRRIVGTLCRTGVIRSEVGVFPQTRPTHRSSSLNKDVACLAVAPYPIRESCTLLRKQMDSSHDIHGAPEAGLLQCQDRLSECRDLLTQTNLRDYLELLPESSEELSHLVDSICDGKQRNTKHQSSKYGRCGDEESTLALALHRCTLDGMQLDRIFSIESESVTLNQMQRNMSSPNSTSRPRRCAASPRTPLLDEILSSRPECVLSAHVLLCDGGPSPSSSRKQDDNRLPTEAELDLIRQHLTNYMPHMFMRRHDYRIYTPDIIFENNFVENPYVTIGLTPYVLFMAKCRVYAHFKFANVKMRVLKATIHQEDGTVRIRWRVIGIPQIRAFMFWKFLPWRYKDAVKEESEWIDGFSTFYVQPKSGLVYKHRLDKVIPDDELMAKEETKLDKLRQMVAPV